MATFATKITKWFHNIYMFKNKKNKTSNPIRFCKNEIDIKNTKALQETQKVGNRYIQHATSNPFD